MGAPKRRRLEIEGGKSKGGENNHSLYIRRKRKQMIWCQKFHYLKDHGKKISQNEKRDSAVRKGKFDIKRGGGMLKSNLGERGDLRRKLPSGEKGL